MSPQLVAGLRVQVRNDGHNGHGGSEEAILAPRDSDEVRIKWAPDGMRIESLEFDGYIAEVRPIAGDGKYVADVNIGGASISIFGTTSSELADSLRRRVLSRTVGGAR